jgi:hypothetical protein
MWTTIAQGAARGVVASAVAVWLTSCHSVGPTTIPRDRFDYSSAIGESWKRQTLLNIVRLRYADPPIFVDVGQVVAGYSLETVVSVAGVASSAGAVQGDSTTLGAQGRFTDRPTITYTPLTGNRFIQNIATPITPVAIFEALEAGFPADAMFRIGVSSINGLHNLELDLEGSTAADPRFIEVTQLLREAQKQGLFGIRLQADREGGRTTVVTLRHPHATDELRAKALRVRELLGLDPDATEFELVGGEFASHPKQIAVRGRSLLRVLQLMALFVDVPETDIAEGRATLGPPAGSTGFGFRVLSSDKEPDDAFVSAHYRDRYYYLSDRDLQSKRALSYIMILFSMADRSEEAAKPVLTIPAQ